jgi:uncharacterized lipoprotein YddW (UPF0748 family)
LGESLTKAKTFEFKKRLTKRFGFGAPLLIGSMLMQCLCLSMPLPAFADAPIAVLKSARDSFAYNDAHIGTYEDDFTAFEKALTAANVRFDEIPEHDATAGSSKLSAYKAVIVPLLVDLPMDVVNALIEFQRGGGKLLVTDSGATPLGGAQALEKAAGLTFVRQTTSTEKRMVNWPKSPAPVNEDFAIGSVSSEMSAGENAGTIASWMDATGNKVGSAVWRSGNIIFMTWAPGMQGNITSNATLLGLALDELVPGLTAQSAVQISFADFQTIGQELEYLTKRTEEAIKTARQADLAVPFNVIQTNYEAATAHVKQFQEAYHNRQYYEADEFLKQAREEFSLAFAQSMPVRPVEARNIWLDRGTIVSTKSPQGMAQLFDKLKANGINVVYFETNNAGFVMYPSKIATQNPATIGWDPLGCAVKEAHKRGMELHAWLWTFNVGNTKHNPIVGKEAEWPGPVLTTHKLDWALAALNGQLVPPRQTEFWIDPSNPEGRAYIKSLYLEVVKNYPVEGIQFDYIRYPFNGKGSEMGYDWLGRQKFEQDTGLTLDKLDDATRELWQAWKIQNINSFVKDTSAAIRATRPGIRISAAVYAMPRRMRLNAIQQEWETWVANGWVDTLNPMTYVGTAKELSTMASYVRESCADRALIYPGLSIRQLDTAGMIEQLDTARETGTLGTSIFAAAHLDEKKSRVLKSGPYRKQPTMTPQSEPLRASRLLVDDFAAMVNRYMADPKKHIMSDQASTNDVLMQIENLQHTLRALNSQSSVDQIEAANKDVLTLHNTMKNWLRLEAFIQRGYRAQYIVSYLGQVEAILSYAGHKLKSSTKALAAGDSAMTPSR